MESTFGRESYLSHGLDLKRWVLCDTCCPMTIELRASFLGFFDESRNYGWGRGGSVTLKPRVAGESLSLIDYLLGKRKGPKLLIQLVPRSRLKSWRFILMVAWCSSYCKLYNIFLGVANQNLAMSKF